MLSFMGALFRCRAALHAAVRVAELVREVHRLGCVVACSRAAIVCIGMALAGLDSLKSDELLPPETEITGAIDHYVQAQLASENIIAAPPADELTLLRRTTLDLAGRIPTLVEVDWYASLPQADRRRMLVDRLMNSIDFDFHHRNWLEETLLPNKRDDEEFRAYLLTAVESRKSWEAIFRDVMKAAAVDGPEKGAARFLKNRVSELDDLTNDTAILFFGVNISCAKCHDHPLVTEWKQDHFYGMQSFFRRTYSTRKTSTLAERPFGEVKFSAVGGEEKSARFMFLTGATVADRTPMFSDEERKQLEERVRKLENEDTESEILVPEFRPREELVEVALQDQKDRFFARNIVNRTWARLLGAGLVEPLDQLHSQNPSSHPQLFDWLTNDTIIHGYDLRRLIQGIVLSEAYARSGRWDSAEEPPDARKFALAATKALTPRQLTVSLQLAVKNPEQWPAIDQADDWRPRRTELENQSGGWIREFELPTENFQISVDEALFFSNNDRVQNELLGNSDDRLVGWLRKSDPVEKRIELLWRTVLTRNPAPEETASALAWLNRSTDHKDESLRQLLWALLAGPEFRFSP